MTTGRLAAAWNIPHITYAGTAEALGNKTEFSTLTRLSFSMNEAGVFFKKVLQVIFLFFVFKGYETAFLNTSQVALYVRKFFVF